jgi:hypothetical protein
MIVSNEMDTDSIEKRMDSVLGKFDLARYLLGKLTPREEGRLRALTKVYDNLSDLYVMNGAGKHVNEVEYDVIALEPSILVVDGIYLTDMGKNDRTADTIAASAAYQRLGKRHEIPVIATSQMIEGQTKYARALGEDADIILRMWRKQEMKDAKLMGLRFNKIRQFDNEVEAYMNWDFKQWLFSEADLTTGSEATFNG